MLLEIKKDGSTVNDFSTSFRMGEENWIEYILKTRFDTRALGVLDITYRYVGEEVSEMIVLQETDAGETSYRFSFPTEIFKDYTAKLLNENIAAWDRKKFDVIKEILVNLYNSVLSNGVCLREQRIQYFPQMK